MTFRLQDKEHLVVVGNRLTITGLAFLAIAMTGAIGLEHGGLLPRIARPVRKVVEHYRDHVAAPIALGAAPVGGGGLPWVA